MRTVAVENLDLVWQAVGSERNEVFIQLKHRAQCSNTSSASHIKTLHVRLTLHLSRGTYPRNEVLERSKHDIKLPIHVAKHLRTTLHGNLVQLY